MRVFVSALLLLVSMLLLVSVAASPAQPPKPADKKPADKKPADKKPADKMDKTSATSATEVKNVDGETLDQWIKKLESGDASLRDTALRVVPAFGAPAEKALPKILSMMVPDTITASKLRQSGSQRCVGVDADKPINTLTKTSIASWATTTARYGSRRCSALADWGPRGRLHQHSV